MKNFSLLTTFGVSLIAVTVAPPRAFAHPAPARSWVMLKAATDQARYTPGQPIEVRLIATNTFKRDAYLQFTSGQRFDFTVYATGKSDAVYSWGATRMFTRMLGSLRLKPGQSQRYVEVIGDEMGQLKPGKYRLIAHLANSPRRIAAAPVMFEVVKPTLSMKTRTDKINYKIGEPVRIDVAVTNRAGKATRAVITAGMACEVFISDEAGNPVWTYSANLRFRRALGAVTWRQGETKTYSSSWNGVPLPRETTESRLQPGRYRIQAVLQTAPQLYAAPVEINITR